MCCFWHRADQGTCWTIKMQYIAALNYIFHSCNEIQMWFLCPKVSTECVESSSVLSLSTDLYLQNPQDCSKARKLVCNINKGCGYGCQLHHVVYCFMIAYGTQRTLILESQNWRYATGGWETVFKPVSDSCTDRTGASTGHWSGE